MESKFSPVYTDKILLIQRNILHHQQVLESYTKLSEPIRIPPSVVTFDATRSLQSWTKVLGQFCISGRFPIHTGPTPPLTPQTTLDACIQNFFQVSTSYRVGGRRTARKIRKGCTVLWGNPEWKKNMNIALLSPDLGLNCSKILIAVQKQVKSNGNHFSPNRCMARAKRGCGGRKDSSTLLMLATLIKY